jgi:uncharacterized protein (TIGR03435 family)
MVWFQHLGRELLAVLGATMLVGPVSITAVAQATTSQSNAQRPSFEVASVRAHDTSDRKNWNTFQAYPGGRFTSTNCSPWMLIHYGFQVQPFQISGGPGWIKSKGYDLNAKPAEVHTFDDIPLMLQGVLEDRFKLKYHWETRELPGYELVVIKPGELRESILKGECPPPLTHLDEIPKDGPCGGLQNSSGHTKGYDLTAGELADSFSWLLSKPISDKTNLAGRYDVELRWTPESVEMRPDASSEQDAPDIFTAVQEQLGLKLQPAKAPVRVLIIDHIETPSDN